MRSTWTRRIAARLATYLDETCRIEREWKTQTSTGHGSRGRYVVADGVACRVIDAGQSNTAATGEVGSAESMTDEYRIICPPGTDFAPDDRVIVGARVYRVVRVRDDRTDAVDTQAVIKREREA